jgi:hypothetical protein
MAAVGRPLKLFLFMCARFYWNDKAVQETLGIEMFQIFMRFAFFGPD